VQLRLVPWASGETKVILEGGVGGGVEEVGGWGGVGWWWLGGWSWFGVWVLRFSVL